MGKGKCKDKKVGNNGGKLINLIGDIGGYILNGVASGDKKGEFTFIGVRDGTVIDYVIVNENGNEVIKSFKVGERVDSDYSGGGDGEKWKT